MNNFYMQIILKHSGLKAEADRLAEWEKTLTEKEAALQNRAEALSSKGVQRICSDFRSTQQMMENLRLSVVELKNTMDSVARGDEKAVQDLCQLCQDMEANASEEVQAAGFILAKILQEHFSAVPFAPTVGNFFDPLRHERQDTSLKGSYVGECFCSGWQRGDTILVKSVVNTKE